MIRNPRILKLLGIRPKTVVHVGAHHAQDDYNYQSLGVSRVLWFEADEMNVEWIRNNKPNVEVKHSLIWETANKQITFYAHLDSSQSSANAPRSVELTTTRIYKTSTLDDEFNDFQLEKPIALIIDVQGSELEVLAGAKNFLTEVSYLVVEISSVNTRYQAMPEPLELSNQLYQRGFLESISRFSHDKTYKDQLFISGGRLDQIRIILLDRIITTILLLKHVVTQRHVTLDYRSCSKCLVVSSKTLSSPTVQN